MLLVVDASVVVKWCTQLVTADRRLHRALSASAMLSEHVRTIAKAQGERGAL